MLDTCPAFDFQQYLSDRRSCVEERLAQYLNGSEPATLLESMRYSVLGGGKRLRAMLCLAAAEAVWQTTHKGLPAASSASQALEVALPCACAIEIVHAMSLIHDDLPVMDNDDFRRGRPANHKVFGDAMALLAGDALLVLPFEILAQHRAPGLEPSILLDVVAKLAAALGAEGLVGGQTIDLQLTGQAGNLQVDLDVSRLEGMHRRKTGALLRFSVWSGSRLAGADRETLAMLSRWAEVLGLAFQVRDDLLDATSTREVLGKTPGKDAAANKITWVSLFGLDRAQQRLQELELEGKALLTDSGLPISALQPLDAMLAWAVHRHN
jgi:geranylgeranyl diphosphate synthase, type II